MADIKFKIGTQYGELDPGSIIFDIISRESLGLDQGLIDGIYIDGQNERYVLRADQLFEPANGDGVYLNGEDLQIRTTSNRVICCDRPSEIDGGTSQFAFGVGLKSSYSNQFIIGQYNANNSDSIIEIGNGTADDKRSNLLRVTKNGQVRLGNVDKEYAHFDKAQLEFKSARYADASIDKTFYNVIISSQQIQMTNSNIDVAKLSYSGLLVNGISSNDQSAEIETSYAVESITHRNNSTNNTVSIDFTSDTITLTTPSIETGGISLSSGNALNLLAPGGFTLVTDSTRGTNHSGLIGVYTNSEDKKTSLTLETINSGKGQSSSIKMTEQLITFDSDKMQFNCDKNNMVDKNNDPLFEGSQFLTMFTIDGEKDEYKIFTTASQAPPCPIKKDYSFLPKINDKTSLTIAEALQVIQTAKIQVDNYLYGTTVSYPHILFRYNNNNGKIEKVVEVDSEFTIIDYNKDEIYAMTDTKLQIYDYNNNKLKDLNLSSPFLLSSSSFQFSLDDFLVFKNRNRENVFVSKRTGKVKSHFSNDTVIIWLYDIFDNNTIGNNILHVNDYNNPSTHTITEDGYEPIGSLNLTAFNKIITPNGITTDIDKDYVYQETELRRIMYNTKSQQQKILMRTLNYIYFNTDASRDGSTLLVNFDTSNNRNSFEYGLYNWENNNFFLLWQDLSGAGNTNMIDKKHIFNIDGVWTKTSSSSAGYLYKNRAYGQDTIYIMGYQISGIAKAADLKED